MNALSWMLYAADVADRVGTALAVIGFMCAGLLLGGALIRWINNTELGNDESKRAAADFAHVTMTRHVPMLLLVAIVGLCFPSKSTIYLIAASEAGEAVATSAEGAAMLSDLRDIIKAEIAKMKAGE